MFLIRQILIVHLRRHRSGRQHQHQCKVTHLMVMLILIQQMGKTRRWGPKHILLRNNYFADQGEMAVTDITYATFYECSINL